MGQTMPRQTLGVMPYAAALYTCQNLLATLPTLPVINPLPAPTHVMRCVSSGSPAACAAAAATPCADTSIPVTVAPMRASGSLNSPPPQPTSSTLRPARGSAVLGLRPRMLHSPWRRKLQRAVLRACRAANGPAAASHQWSASAANLAASRLSSELEAAACVRVELPLPLLLLLVCEGWLICEGGLGAAPSADCCLGGCAKLLLLSPVCMLRHCAAHCQLPDAVATGC